MIIFTLQFVLLITPSMNVNKKIVLSKEPQIVAEMIIIEPMNVSRTNPTETKAKSKQNRTPKAEMADAITQKRKRIGAVRTKTGTSSDDIGDGSHSKRWIK